MTIFQSLDKNKTLWRHGVQEPLFAITNLLITSDNSKICGKSANTIQIYDSELGIKYVMFFCTGDEELYQWISDNWEDKEADVTVVGTLGLNMYDGKLDKQVIIVDATIQN